MKGPASAPIVQVTPPLGGGVADYAAALHALWQSRGVAAHVLPLGRADHLKAPLAARVRELAGERAIIVLHYSGYGYAPRGLCGWLLDALEATACKRCIAVVHELHASGPPWRSAFWTRPVQQRIAARLARSADALWTNTTEHGRWLHSHAPAHVPVRVTPVFSNVGEADVIVPLREREAAALVFGSAATRQRLFSALRGRERSLQALGIERIVEVGPGPPSRRSTALPRCEHAGVLVPAELARVLASMRVGLLDYPLRHLGKSGVYAAYASFGCLAANTASDRTPADRLAAGGEFVELGQPCAPAAQQEIAVRAHRWYRRHALHRQADELLVFATGDAAAEPSERAMERRGDAHRHVLRQR